MKILALPKVDGQSPELVRHFLGGTTISYKGERYVRTRMVSNVLAGGGSVAMAYSSDDLEKGNTYSIKVWFFLSTLWSTKDKQQDSDSCSYGCEIELN